MAKKVKDPYALRDIFKEMEMELVASLRRNFINHKVEEQAHGFSWEMWQKAKLRNLQEYRKETTSVIYRFKKRISAAIEQVLRNHFSVGERKADIKLPQDGVSTALPGEEPPQEKQFFSMNKKKLDALIKSTKNDFEDVQQAVYRKMDDVYRQTIFKTEFQLSSGAISLGKAIDKATEDFLAKGVNCIAYKDKNGEIMRYVNIADYAEMALRTASHRATLLGEGSKRDELGVHLVFVSAHANACKLCLPWQGQILIDDVFSHPSKEYIAKYKSKYKLLSDAIKAGLLHPNCRHTLATYFEGVTRMPKPQDPEKALENYNNEQMQRKLEREIRKRKRILAGTVEDEDQKEAQHNLRIAQKNLRDFLKRHPEFKRQSRREKIYDAKNIKNMMSSEDIQKVKGNKISDELMPDIEEGIRKMNKEFPSFKELVSKITYDPSTEKEYAYSETGINEGKVSTTIKVGKIFSDRSALLQSINKDINGGHTYKNMTPKSLIVHECTHALEINLTIKELGIDASKATDSQWLEFKSKYGTISGELKEQAMKNLSIEFMQPKWYKVYEELGNYAKINSSEFLAQCVSQVLTTENPSEIALEVFKLLKERME
ncbi:phage minor capsid protein [[Clostridium] innocuum]|nr:phage minor capsid protein [[Clostridium] innocuum]